jgi:hypothetical protein
MIMRRTDIATQKGLRDATALARRGSAAKTRMMEILPRRA